MKEGWKLSFFAVVSQKAMAQSLCFACALPYDVAEMLRDWFLVYCGRY